MVNFSEEYSGGGGWGRFQYCGSTPGYLPPPGMARSLPRPFAIFRLLISLTFDLARSNWFGRLHKPHPEPLVRPPRILSHIRRRILIQSRLKCRQAFCHATRPAGVSHVLIKLIYTCIQLEYSSINLIICTCIKPVCTSNKPVPVLNPCICIKSVWTCIKRMYLYYT